MKWASIRRIPGRQWRAWFAWHPVRVYDTVVWMERVARREQLFPSGTRWEYTLLSTASGK